MSPFVFALCFLLFVLFVIISKFELVSVLNFFSLHCYDCIPFASVYNVYSVFIQVFVIAMLFISKASWVVKKKKKSHCIRIRSKHRLFTNQTASLDSFLGRMPVVWWGGLSRVNVGFNTLRPWCGLLTHWGPHQVRQKIPQRLDGLFKNVS